MKDKVLKTSLLAVIFFVLCFSFTVNAEILFNLTPTDDAYVDINNPTTNFNTTDLLAGVLPTNCAIQPIAERYRTYLKFNLGGFSSFNLTNVTLRMTSAANGNPTGYCEPGVNLYNITTPCSWNESDITWNTQCGLSVAVSSNPIGGTAALAGVIEDYNSPQLVADVIKNIGLNYSLVLQTNSRVLGDYGSKDGNPNYVPQLILQYGSVTPENTSVPPGTSGVINYVNLENTVTIGTTKIVTISFTNTGSLGRFKVGFSIGNNTKGFCNTDCYVGGDLDPFSGTVWFAIVNAGPGETRVVSLPYTFLANHFDENNTYTVLSTLRPSDSFTILSNTSSLVTVNAVQPASANITVVNFPSPYATVDQSYNVTVAFVNTGNFTSSYKVGFSIGRNDTGFCNSGCYMPLGSGGYFDPTTGTRWLGSATVNPGETALVKLPFNFRSDFFTLGYAQDVRVTVRPINTLDVLDGRVFNAAIIPVNFPSTTGARIVNVTLSDYNPTIDQIITASVKVINNGTEAAEFPVGISIGKNGVFCNRDCYVDCLSPPNPAPPSPYFCDYKSTGLIHPNQTVTINRQFRFIQQNFEQGQTYDIIASVSYFPYSSPALSYDYKTFPNAVNISDVSTKLSAYAIGATATPDSVQIRNVTFGQNIVDFDVFVVNNASLTYNYTIGLSIGLWNTTDGATFNAPLPDLVPPCNKLCYTDNLGSWVSALIPPGYSAPIHRQMKVPGYLLENTSFDLAVGVWTAPAEVYPDPYVGKLISITYFKNVAFIRTPTGFSAGITPTIGAVLGGVLGASSSAALAFLSLIITSIATAYVGYKSKDGTTAGITAILVMFVFIFIGWIPLWVLLVIGVITAFVISKFAKGTIG